MVPGELVGSDLVGQHVGHDEEVRLRSDSREPLRLELAVDGRHDEVLHVRIPGWRTVLPGIRAVPREVGGVFERHLRRGKAPRQDQA